MQTDDLMTIATAAKECGVVKATLYSAIKAGKLKFVTVDGVRFFTRSDLYEWRRGVRKYVRNESYVCMKLRIQKELYKKLACMAKGKRVSMTALINTAIERMIAEEEK